MMDCMYGNDVDIVISGSRRILEVAMQRSPVSDIGRALIDVTVCMMK